MTAQAKLLPMALTGHSRRSERMLGEERRFKQNHSMRMRHAVSAATHWESRRTYRTVSMAAVAKYTLIVSCAALNITSRRESKWPVPSAGLSGAMTHLTCLKRTRRSTVRQNRKLRKKRRKLSSWPNWLISKSKCRMRRPNKQIKMSYKMIDHFNVYAARGA